MKSIAELKQEAEHRFNQYKSGPKAKWTEPQKVCKEELGFYDGDSEGIFDVYRAFKYPDSGEFIPFLGVSEPQELEFEIRFVTSSAKSEIEEQEYYDFNIGRLPLGFVLKKQIKTNKLILDFDPALKSMHTTDVFQLKPCAKPQSARNADMSIAKRKRRKDLLAEVDISLRIYEGLDELSSDSNEEHGKKHREIYKRKKLKKLIIEAYFGEGINEVLNCDYLLLNSDFLYYLRRIHGYTLEQIEFFTKLHGYRIKAKYSLQAMLDAFDILVEEMQEKINWYNGGIYNWDKEHPIAIMDRVITVYKYSKKKVFDLSYPHYGTYYYCQYEADAKIDGGQIITTKFQKAIEGKNLRVVEKIERCLKWDYFSFNALELILEVCVMPGHRKYEIPWIRRGRPPTFAELTYEWWLWVQLLPNLDIGAFISSIYTGLIMHDLCCGIAWQSSHHGIYEPEVIDRMKSINDHGIIMAILLSKNNCYAIDHRIEALGSSGEERDRYIYKCFEDAKAIGERKIKENIASKKALQKGNTTKHNTSLIKKEFRYNYLKLGVGIFVNFIGNIGLLSCFYDPTKQLSGFSCLKAISCTALMYRFNTNLLTQHPGKYDVIGAMSCLLLGGLELIALLIKAEAPEIPLSKFGQNRFSEFMWDFFNQPWLGKCPKQYCYMASAATAFTTVIAFAKYYRTTEEGTVNYNLDLIEIIIDKVNSWVWGTSKQEPQDTVAPGVR